MSVELSQYTILYHVNAVVEIFVQYTLLPRSYGALLVDTVVGMYVAMETAGGIYNSAQLNMK